MVHIKKYGTGRCVFCQQEKEGYDCEFTDGSLKGFLCVRHFNHAAKMRSENGESQKEKSKV